MALRVPANNDPLLPTSSHQGRRIIDLIVRAPPMEIGEDVS